MSLAVRLLAVVLLLNLLVVGGVQTALFALQQEWIRRQQGENLAAALVPYLLDVYSAERLGDDTQARALVQSPLIREYFEDVVVTSGRPPLSGLVYLNPRGAVHRDPDRFALADVLDGMQRARAHYGLVQVAGGYCAAVRTEERVAGYLWFVPRLDIESPSVPWWFLLATALGSSLLFGLVLYPIVVRTIGRPLQRIGVAAERVGAGSYEVRLPTFVGAPELAALVQSFNAMAAKVQDNTAHLEAAVRSAVEEAKRTERALVQSSRLATVGTLAAGIAHEINNPIGGMQNAVVRLLADQKLTDKQVQYLQLLQDGLQRVARTARKVLDFSPKQVAARPFFLRGCIEGARSLCDHRMQRLGVVMRVDGVLELPEAIGDPHEIQQVVLNLFLNSLDAFEERGRAGTIAVRGAVEGEMVRLDIVDDGPGMDPADLGRVMDPFFTRKERPDASGLGMFISYSIVRNHGGTMVVDSSLGRGFTVVMHLPRAQKP
jgi:signal transduction histidine kinase